MTNNKNENNFPQDNNSQARTFFGHPLGLLNLFSTEFCERFSYYGMRAILVFYIYANVGEGGLGLSMQDALFAMSLFGGSVYLLSVIGGWLADRIFSSYKSVFIGGVIIAIGHIVLSLPFTKIPGTFCALSLIALGTGLLKPNISQMVGDLYEENDRRQVAGFNLFVMGINLGSFFSPLITGYVQKIAGYHIAFSIPAILMFVALFIYSALSKNTLFSINKKPIFPLAADEAHKLVKNTIFAVVIIIALLTPLHLLKALTLENFSIILPVACTIIVIGLFASIFTDGEVTEAEKNKVKAYIAVFIASTIFWAIEELQSSVFAVLADTRANNNMFGFEIPAAWYQSINPLIIVILAPILAYLWQRWKNQPSAFSKIIFALILSMISFIIPAVCFAITPNNIMISPLLVALPIILFSNAELFISPIGLSSTTDLAPKNYKSRFYSLWFLSNTLGQGINAYSVRFFNEDAPSLFFAGYSVGVAIIILGLLIMLKPLKKLCQN